MLNITNNEQLVRKTYRLLFIIQKICSCALNNRKTRLVRPAITKA
nr:MAG TPA: hypothetical protein [Caudoviricetes sp.]